MKIYLNCVTGDSLFVRIFHLNRRVMHTTFSPYRRGLSLACTAFVLVLALAGMSACRKGAKPVATDIGNPVQTSNSAPENTLTDVVGVINIQKSADGTSASVACSRHEMLFTALGADLISGLEHAQQQNVPVRITFDLNRSLLLRADPVTTNEEHQFKARIVKTIGSATDMESLRGNEQAINHFADMGVINTTEPGLTPVVPDMATAQQMFNYFSTQCCQNPGPYDIDHCITFQYCADGCYARAHKMCYLINNKYHYATQKIFSFATGSYSLSVKAGKWCDQCINWWYHVAPLVTIQTTKGPKAYVFDPSMFDEPVLLATWLHAQENPACSSTPRVTAINIQPTSSYSPLAYGITTIFDTDPLYSDTNSTLVSYHYLHTCP